MADLIREVTVEGPGQCVVHNLDGLLWVERADPAILVPEFLLGEIKAGRGRAGMRLDVFRGDHVLVIEGSNQVVRYRLSDFDQVTGMWLGTLV